MTRVELHGIAHGNEAYVRLHELMRKSGFLTTILGDDTVTYRLPPAEYSKVCEDSLEVTFNMAKTVANAITTKNAVFVSLLHTAKWEGLMPV